MTDFLENISEDLKRFVDPSLPKETRLMAAGAMVPLPPKDLVNVLYALTLDQDEDVSSQAEVSLKSLPGNLLDSVLLDQSISPEVLDYFGRNLTNNSQLEKIILNQAAKESTIAFLAETVSDQKLIEIIANNQQRILHEPKIVEALSKNSTISRSTLDRVIFFFKLHLQGKGEILPSEVEEEGQASTESAQETLETEPAKPPEGVPTGVEEVEESFLDEIDFPDELKEEVNLEVSEEREKSPFLRGLSVRIQRMTVAEKIKLAIVGNREARSILIHDSNRIISTAVVRNPRLTETEVIRIAQSKTIDEEVLRMVSENREWTKVYQVKLSLVNNAKTPSPVALRFLSHLRERDLQVVSINKNIPGIISSTARKVVKEKKERKTGALK